MEEVYSGRQADSIVSVAIKINDVSHLYKLDQRETLDQVIEAIKLQLGLPINTKYALQFDQRNFFVTEQNRQQIKNGDICLLVYAPEVMTKGILDQLSEQWALKKLLDFVGDDCVVFELEKQDGVSKIVALLQEASLAPDAQELAFQLVAELFMLDKVPVRWLKGRLLNRVITQVSGEFSSSWNTLAACLRIYLALYTQGPDGQTEIPDIAIEKIASHFDSSSLRVQEMALTLFNAHCEEEGQPDRKLVLKVRDQLCDTIANSYAYLSKDFQHQLALFQKRLLTRLLKKFESPANMEDPQVQRRLSELTLVDKKRNKRNTNTETTLRLLAEFVAPEPDKSTLNLLLLDCLTHSVRNQTKHLSGALMEHQPSLQLCNQLIQIQAEAIGMFKRETAPLHPVLFCDRAFEEIFCASVRNLNKTCKEMRAKGDDLAQILKVHGKKIQLALAEHPLTLDVFEVTLSRVSYGDVWVAWHEEKRIKEERIFKNYSFLELREKLRPQYQELVKKQRLEVMTRGTVFKKYPLKAHHQKTSKDRFWTVTLISGAKTLKFQDSDKNFNSFSIELNQIKNVLVGCNCPHVKLRESKYNPEHALSINLTTADPEFLNLGPVSAKDQDYWFDGIRMLLGQSMTSNSYCTEMEELLDMHLRLRLLEIEDIEFPDGPPPQIPEPPTSIPILRAESFV